MSSPNSSEDLIKAIKKTDFEKIKDLLSAGVNINAGSKYGTYSPLHAAIQNKKAEKLVRILLKHGADVNINININTPLQYAIHCHKKLKLIEMLLNHGADVNARNNIHGNTALHSATKHRDGVKVIKMLLQRGAEVDIRNWDGFTALHYATCSPKGPELIRELLQYESDINALDEIGDTPLHVAAAATCHCNKMEVIKILLEQGADINILNIKGGTPVHSILRKLLHQESMPFFRIRKCYEIDRECATLLIKMTLIENIDICNYIINFIKGIGSTNITELILDMDGCICEIHRMQADMINVNLSLYDAMNSAIIKTLHVNDTITDTAIFTKYPVYYDIISWKLKYYLERADLLNNVDLRIYSVTDNMYSEQKFFLNFYSAQQIAKYLCNDDLINVLAAFNKYEKNEANTGDK